MTELHELTLGEKLSDSVGVRVADGQREPLLVGDRRDVREMEGDLLREDVILDVPLTLADFDD